MKKTLLAVAASGLIAVFATHFADAAEHHSGKVHHRTYTNFRDSNAYAAPAYAAPQPDFSRYSGYAGMDGH
jgi:hypothetical protein